MTEIARRIEARLRALGKNPSAVALEAGLGRSAIRDILVGKVEHPRIDTLRKLTTPLLCSLEYLTGADKEPGLPAPRNRPLSEGTFDPQEVLTVTPLEVGVFRTSFVREVARARWEHGLDGERNLAPAERFFVYSDPRLPDWRTNLYRINDGSLEDLGILKGDLLTVASPIDGATVIPLKPGSLVVVSHRLPEQSLTETTAREVSAPPARSHPKDFEAAVTLRSRSKENFEPIIISDTPVDEVAETLLPNSYFTNHGNVANIEGLVVRVVRELDVD